MKEPYVHTVEYRLSVVKANSQIMEACIDELDEVVDHVLDDSSTEHLIIKRFIGFLESHFYHFDEMIDFAIKAYSESKGEIDET